MRRRDGWERASTGAQTIKGKAYRKLVEFTRPCATCEKPFSIFVTEKIANGHADSNSFGLKNCEVHRRNKAAPDLGEQEKLRTANVTMSEELAGLYASNRDLFAELQVIKARLARYELPAAMAAQEHTTNSVLPNKMPWE